MVSLLLGQEGYGDVCDPETVRAFIELTHEAYRSRFPGELGKVSCRQCSKGAPSPRQGFKPYLPHYYIDLLSA